MSVTRWLSGYAGVTTHERVGLSSQALCVVPMSTMTVCADLEHTRVHFYQYPNASASLPHSQTCQGRGRNKTEVEASSTDVPRGARRVSDKISSLTESHSDCAIISGSVLSDNGIPVQLCHPRPPT